MTESKKKKLARMWWRLLDQFDLDSQLRMNVVALTDAHYSAGIMKGIQLAIGKKEINKHKPK